MELKEQLLSLVPDIFDYKTVLYVGARPDQFRFGEDFNNAGYKIDVLEAFASNVEWLRKIPWLNKVYCEDLRKFKREYAYDVIFWCHGPEHVIKTELVPIIKQLERMTIKIIVFICPWGEYRQEPIYNNPYEEHLSAYDIDDFESMDFKVIALGQKGIIGSNLIAVQHFKRKAVAIMTYERRKTAYVHQLLESLGNNFSVEDYDYYLFCDGPKTNNIVDYIIDSYNKTKLPRKHKYISKERIGPYENQLIAYNYLLNKYESAIFLEDDVILSKYFLRIISIMLDQFRNDETIGVVSPGEYLNCDDHDIKANLDKAIFKNGHWWAFGMWQNKWSAMAPYYENNKHWSLPDLSKDRAMEQCGFKQLRTVVNRFKGIGEHGIHFSKRLFNDLGLDKVPLNDYDEDLLINSFQIMDN